MRSFCFLTLVGACFLCACENATEITSPEVIEPQFHPVNGTPGDDNAWSMYYFDLDLESDLILKVAQLTPTGAMAVSPHMCPGNDPPGNTHNEPFQWVDFPGKENMAPAFGSGTFANRQTWPWKRGWLRVEKACWFDEWNPGGFPESAWVYGTARYGFRKEAEFWAMLKSRGFPDISHLFPLDLDLAYLHVAGVTEMTLLGETHHEDGTTWIR
jgi:hypothetical protein